MPDPQPDPPPTPGTVSDALGSVGPCPTVRWKGKAYEVAFINPDVLARVELRVAEIARDELKSLAPIYTSAEYAAAERDLFIALTQRKEHRAGGPRWAAAMETPDGLLAILWACVAEKHPEFTPDDASGMTADAPDDVRFAVAMVLPSFFSTAGKVMRADPAKLAELGAAAAEKAAAMVAACAPSSA